MKHIAQIHLDKYNTANYDLVENNIYKNIEEDIFVFALSFELEDNEDSQYPLEDILDKFYLHVSDFLDEDAYYKGKNVKLELAGELSDVQNALKSIIGKRVYNSEYTGEDGKTYVKLMID